MATPMLVLPIERIFKPSGRNHRGIADDRALDPLLADLVLQDLGPERKFGAAPFFQADDWTYVPDIEPFDVARDWPRPVLQALSSGEAIGRAADARACEILLALRNSLA
jgi:hypothetical protein